MTHLAAFLGCLLLGQLPAELTLEVEILEAVEGGPLIVETAVVNRGKKSVEFYFANHVPNATLTLPSDFPRRDVPSRHRVLRGPAERPVVLFPGERIAETHFVHHVCDIRAGTWTLHVEWPLFAREGKMRLLGVLKKDAPLRVSEATSAVFEALRARLTKRIAEKDHDYVGNALLHVRNVAFESVALEMIGAGPPHDVEMMSLVRSLASNPAEADLKLLRHLASRQKCVPTILAYWKGNQVTLSDAVVRELLDDDNVYLGCLALSAFTKSASRDSTGRFMDRLKQLPPPMAEGRFSELVAQLDGADFVARNEAQAALEKLGPDAEPAFRRLLPREPSLELRIRSDQILARWEPQYPQSNSARLIEHLRVLGTPVEIEMLRALAKNSAEAQITQGAKRALRRLGVAN